PAGNSHQYISNMTLIQNLSSDSREFGEILKIITSSYKDPSSVGNFVYSKPRLVHNDLLEKEFIEKRKELKQDGRTDKELAESFCFLLCDAHKIPLICEKGLSVGSGWMTILGNASKGIYLCQFSDLLQVSPQEPGSTGEIIVFKVMKGKVKSIHDNMARTLDPTPKFDSHFSKNANRVTSLQSYRAFEYTQQYFYEYVDFELASRPRHVCPYAVISFQFKGKETTTVGPKLMPMQRYSAYMIVYNSGYIVWRGQFVNRGKEVYHSKLILVLLHLASKPLAASTPLLPVPQDPIMPHLDSFIPAFHYALGKVRCNPPANLGAGVEQQVHDYLSSIREGKLIQRVRLDYDHKLDEREKLFPAPRQKYNWENYVRSYFYNPHLFTMPVENAKKMVEELRCVPESSTDSETADGIEVHSDPERLKELLKLIQIKKNLAAKQKGNESDEGASDTHGLKRKSEDEANETSPKCMKMAPVNNRQPGEGAGMQYRLEKFCYTKISPTVLTHASPEKKDLSRPDQPDSSNVVTEPELEAVEDENTNLTDELKVSHSQEQRGTPLSGVDCIVDEQISGFSTEVEDLLREECVYYIPYSSSQAHRNPPQTPMAPFSEYVSHFNTPLPVHSYIKSFRDSISAFIDSQQNTWDDTTHVVSVFPSSVSYSAPEVQPSDLPISSSLHIHTPLQSPSTVATVKPALASNLTSTAISSLISQLQPEVISNLVKIIQGVQKNTVHFYIHSADEESDVCWEIKEYLKRLGNSECDPQTFLEKKDSQDKLLIIIQNIDIATHVHKIPALVSLKKLPSVSFAGVDSLDDIKNHTYNELFVSGGFIVSDEFVLNPDFIKQERLETLLQYLEELNTPESPWRWRVHCKTHKKVKEQSRCNSEALNILNLLTMYHKKQIVEFLSYHECDGQSRQAPDLNCLVKLQAQNIGQRHVIFLTERRFEMFPHYSSSGIVIANIDDILYNMASLIGEACDKLPSSNLHSCPTSPICKSAVYLPSICFCVH
uniref:DUF3715 domain-containing protein n=1 Tax=Pygocentrus nattereri TaxID=42514 RepID=A0A3B4EM89_PYGNA